MKIFRFFIYILISNILIITSCSSHKIKRVNTYYDNGFRKEKGRLKNDKKDGHWIIYTSTGWIEKREKWKNGEWIWTILYNEKHEKIEWNDHKGNHRTYKPCGCSH